MSLKVASVLAWVLGGLSLLTSLGPLSHFGELTLPARATALWLIAVGVALMVVGYGLRRRNAIAAKLAVVVCGFWLTVQVGGMILAVIRHARWGVTSWVILALIVMICLWIIGAVLKHGAEFDQNTQAVSSKSPPHAA